MGQTLCFACLPENASCESMSFFFVSSFVAEQSSMMYNVGLPAIFKVKQTQQLFKFFCPVRQHGMYYSYFFSFGRRTTPIQLLFLQALFHSMVGQSMTIFSNTPWYSFSSKSRTKTLFPQFVWPHTTAECGYFGNTVYDFSETSIFKNDLRIMYYKKVDI